MRKVLLLLSVLIFAPYSSLDGQEARISISPVAGYIWPSSIFKDHQTRVFSNGGRSEATRHLTVSPTWMIGGRIDFQSRGGWMLGLQGSRGGETGAFYSESINWSADGFLAGLGHTSMELRPTVTAIEASVARRIRTWGWLPDLGLEAGGTWYRFARIGGNHQSCEFYEAFCTDWEDRYDVPSLHGGAWLRKAVTSFSEIHVGVDASIGRTTKGIPWDDYSDPGQKKKIESFSVTGGISLIVPRLEPISRESTPTPPPPVAP